MLKNKKYRTKKKKMYPLIDIFSLFLLLWIPYFFILFLLPLPKKTDPTNVPTQPAKAKVTTKRETGNKAPKLRN